MTKTSQVLCAALLLACAARSPAAPIGISSVRSVANTGVAFAARIEYGVNAFSNGADLRITVDNTTPDPPGDSEITGIAFNIAGLAQSRANSAIRLLDADGTFQLLQGAVAANPLGDFEAGVALGGSWLGGGSPRAGIDRGQSRSFLFDLALTPAEAAALTSESFVSEPAKSPSKDWTGAVFAVRFKAVGASGGGSDKVLGGDIVVIPEPCAVLALLLAGGIARPRRLP